MIQNNILKYIFYAHFYTGIIFFMNFLFRYKNSCTENKYFKVAIAVPVNGPSQVHFQGHQWLV